MSQSTREEIVLRALKQAGRSVEIKAHTEDLLNDILRNLALEFSWPQLRTFGTTLTLNAGSSTAALPSDYGAGIDNLLFGDELLPLLEKDGDDFIFLRGFQVTLTTPARPIFYMIDEQAEVFRFNRMADVNYGFQPIYFRVPPAITDPNEKPWYKDDKSLVELLIGQIYQFTADEREAGQFAKAAKLLADIKRGLIPMKGGSKKLTLARSTFKPRTRLLRFFR